ncbi:MAG: hypothetical protein VCB63_05900, partial [Alphaproteobacteria bacterium]
MTISIPLLDLPFIAKLDSKDAMIWNDSVQDSGANPSAAAEGFVLIPNQKSSARRTSDMSPRRN